MAETGFVATGFYVGSLTIALSGIVARQKAIVLQAEVDRLRQDVNALSHAEQRRFMGELKEQRVSIVPASGICLQQAIGVSATQIPLLKRLRTKVARNAPLRSRRRCRLAQEKLALRFLTMWALKTIIEELSEPTG
jgi:hypothetical protein